MKFITWLRRDRVAELLTDDGLEARLRWALHAGAERLFPGSHTEHFDGKPRLCGIGACKNHAMPGRSFCRECHEAIFACKPIPCDFEDNYVCARHSNG